MINHAMPEAIIARPSEKIGAKTKTSLVVAECGSRSSGVKNQAAEKKIATVAAANAKVAETTKRGLDLSNAVVITIRPMVGGIQFHRRSLVPSCS